MLQNQSYNVLITVKNMMNNMKLEKNIITVYNILVSSRQYAVENRFDKTMERV